MTWSAPGTAGPGQADVRSGADAPGWAGVCSPLDVPGRAGVPRWANVPSWAGACGRACTRDRGGRRHGHGCRIAGTRNCARVLIRTRGRVTAGQHVGTRAIARWPTCAIARKPAATRAIGSWPAGARALAGT